MWIGSLVSFSDLGHPDVDRFSIALSRIKKTPFSPHCELVRITIFTCIFMFELFSRKVNNCSLHMAWLLSFCFFLISAFERWHITMTDCKGRTCN